MKIDKIDHIGIAVASIDEALSVYRALGLVEGHREKVSGQQVAAAFLPVGESQIELLEPLGEVSPVARFLKKRGPGVHHICFAVGDLAVAIAELQQKGFRLVNSSPVPGAQGKNVAFLHPESGKGVLIELAERSKP
jgi:methylmalonyl-CoA/ethylmalonyl-CoA epimerase